MAQTDVDICSQALVQLGGKPINSLSDGTDRANICSTIYPKLRDGYLSRYPWRFSKKHAQLSRLTAAPAAEWTYQFTLPSDRMTNGVCELYPSSSVHAAPIKNFEIVGSLLLADEKELWAEYQYAITEAAFPAYFADFLAAALSARIAFAVTDQQNTAEFWKGIAFGPPGYDGDGGLYADAKFQDARLSPNIAVADNTLIDARAI